MEHYTSLPYSNSLGNGNYIEIEQIVKFCIYCDKKILSNVGFFNKLPGDELPGSTTICGFCVKCQHHVMPSDCYTKVEYTWPEDNSIKFNHIYKEKSDIDYSVNPLVKN